MRIRAVFLDLSGVLYQGTRRLPGADRALDQLRATALPLRFVTNTSQRSRTQLLDDLTRLGLDIHSDELFTAPLAARRWLESHGYRPFCLLHPHLQAEFADLPQTDPNAVLIGDAADGFTYTRLDKAFQLLHDGAPLLAIGVNRYYQLDDGLHLDAGPFVKALEYAADSKAIVTGKPSSTFFQQVLEHTGIRAAETLMIGDDALSDVQGALDTGLQGCLVKTGKYRPGDEEKIQGEFWLEADIEAAVERLLHED